MTEKYSLPIACNKDCGGSCALLAHLRDSRIHHITDNPLGGEYMKGCIKGFMAPQALYSDQRLKKPLIRNGPRGSTGSFKEVEWSHALQLVADRLADLKDKHGSQCILPLGRSGSCRSAFHNTEKLLFRFFGGLGGYVRLSGNYSAAAASFVIPHVTGFTPPGIDPGALQDSKLILLWGHNAMDCRFGSELPGRLLEAKKRGVEIIVIDPRKTSTVSRLAGRWIRVRPGTDAALMLAVLYVLIDEEMINNDFVERYSIGFPELKQYVLGQSSADSIPKTPEWAEGICGTPAAEIVELARIYGKTQPAALIPGLSIQRTIGGEEPLRLAVALQLATGNTGKRGGSSGSLTWQTLPGPQVGSLPLLPNPVTEHVPIVRWPDFILEGTAGDYPTEIKATYSIGGNLLSQGSDIKKSIAAFEKAEFSVCHDHFLTPTAQHCDVVLPATMSLEREDLVFGGGGNYLLFSHQAVTPQGHSRNDYDILCELSAKLGFEETFSENRTENEWLDHFISESEITDAERFKESGIYWGKEQTRVGLSDFVDDPESHPLFTPSGKIEIASADYTKTGFPAIPQYRGLEDDPDYPLRLVTPKSRYQVHSQNFNLPWYQKREQRTLWMHPEDANDRGLKDGSLVLISSHVGQVKIPLEITTEIMPGVVSLLAGAWPEFNADGIEIAGSANTLTPTTPTLPSQGARTHSVLVEVVSA